MSVIPLTLTISLCLVFTFVIFFIREQARRPFSSSERESLLPLADETPRLARAPVAAVPPVIARRSARDPHGLRSVDPDARTVA